MEKHQDGENIKKTSWQTDGDRVEPASLTKILFTKVGFAHNPSEKTYVVKRNVVENRLDSSCNLERAISFEKQPRRGEMLIVKTLNYHKAPAERYI